MARASGRTWLLGGAAALVVAIVAGVALLRHERPDPGAGSAASAASALLAPSAAEKRWQDLTPAQQAALEPLKAGWDDLGPVRKQKWLEIAGRYATMKPAEQKRVHERMREWVALSPEERKAVRESYARAQKIVGGKKAAQWEQYQLLPEEEKRKLANANAAKKQQVAKPPTPAQSLVKTPTPIKPHPGLATAGGTAAPTTPVAPAPVVPVPAAPVVPPPAPAPVQEMEYPLEGAATPAAMMQQNPPAPPPAPQPAPQPVPAPPNAGK
ncbi:uncharacterized protein DUF3106 [Pseudoduganella flava]|uniref:DUF3106 domain-containing protein n=1 Tax=Pseudoduganella flava TaxID=871742 RepID=A0A562PER8_9BURK|nr:DUF3106 domain-containing protein [Pseudoduganella flava]QGZ38884.1 DUF3106 domain-containing protein [Pseudoduganella flava]TWI42955.1 uncharacterized protein DUF3106 [Pseudoduganella flava]